MAQNLTGLQMQIRNSMSNRKGKTGSQLDMDVRVLTCAVKSSIASSVSKKRANANARFLPCARDVAVLTAFLICQPFVPKSCLGQRANVVENDAGTRTEGVADDFYSV